MLCAVLLAAATRQNILRLREQGGEAALEKYARIGRLFSARDTAGRDEACDSLVEILENWQERLTVPRLSDYGLQVDALEDIANQTRCKNNPAALSVSHLVSILEERL
ncbi:iron-containing alcohol dehydrogenase [Prosthecochloris sp. HL-130-GSB]|uniref:iron-containing alcohol dehydrogenase n=1 Tax=Prosthecochloris sp. HL-130-GSB TaxID=1974213 RepID=UPI0035153472